MAVGPYNLSSSGECACGAPPTGTSFPTHTHTEVWMPSMRTLLEVLAERRIRRVVLHASEEGRRLYERLGFVQTNEMRLGPA